MKRFLFDGSHEKCGNRVEKKNLKQWMLRIPLYAERLLKGIDKLDWPEGIKDMQRNWIGRSTGAEVDFRIDGLNEKLTVFTTRPDTLFGATYMVIAPEHPLTGIITLPAKRRMLIIISKLLHLNPISTVLTWQRKKQASSPDDMPLIL